MSELKYKHEDLGLWFKDSNPDGEPKELAEFDIDSNNPNHEIILLRYPQDFENEKFNRSKVGDYNDITVTEDIQTQRYILTFVRTEKSVTEIVKMRKYYSMSSYDLKLVFKQQK
jgi:hypothetical protein